MTKKKIKNRNVYIILISITLLTFFLLFVIKRHLVFAALDVVSGCETTKCVYALSLDSGVTLGSYEKDKEFFLYKNPFHWSTHMRIGKGDISVYWTSDGLEGIYCGSISYIGPGISYHYIRDFKPTNIYTYTNNTYVLIDQTWKCR